MNNFREMLSLPSFFFLTYLRCDLFMWSIMHEIFRNRGKTFFIYLFWAFKIFFSRNTFFQYYKIRLSVSMNQNKEQTLWLRDKVDLKGIFKCHLLLVRCHLYEIKTILFSSVEFSFPCFFPEFVFFWVLTELC